MPVKPCLRCLVGYVHTFRFFFLVGWSARIYTPHPLQSPLFTPPACKFTYPTHLLNRGIQSSCHPTCCRCSVAPSTGSSCSPLIVFLLSIGIYTIYVLTPLLTCNPPSQVKDYSGRVASKTGRSIPTKSAGGPLGGTGLLGIFPPPHPTPRSFFQLVASILTNPHSQTQSPKT